ncbi:PadR family transcriptional regulator [Vibrio sp. HN007]|uniref:PadR family transcriptional regulator n=1 Tax=Vibrio iocasae TaxID=3098914 RepID=UPI0035D4F023
MTLQAMILSLIKQNTSGLTGYEISLTLNTRLSHIWKASHQQIYRELKVLVESQLILKKTERQTSKPDRHRYTITKDGCKKLEKLSQQSVPLPAVRDSMLVQLYALDNDKEMQRCVLSEYHRCCIAYKSELENTLLTMKDREQQGITELLCIDKKIMEVECQIRWASRWIEELSEGKR